MTKPSAQHMAWIVQGRAVGKFTWKAASSLGKPNRPITLVRAQICQTTNHAVAHVAHRLVGMFIQHNVLNTPWCAVCWLNYGVRRVKPKIQLKHGLGLWKTLNALNHINLNVVWVVSCVQIGKKHMKWLRPPMLIQLKIMGLTVWLVSRQFPQCLWWAMQQARVI